jgi:hypothetical protein
MNDKAHEIGGFHVLMSDGAIRRWNAGKTTPYDLRVSRVYLPIGDSHYITVSLRRATSRLMPDVAEQMAGSQANRIA